MNQSSLILSYPPRWAPPIGPELQEIPETYGSGFDGWKEAKKDSTCNDFVGIVKLLSSPTGRLDIKAQKTPISLAKYLHLLPFLPSLLLGREMGCEYAVWREITTVPRVIFVSGWC